MHGKKEEEGGIGNGGVPVCTMLPLDTVSIGSTQIGQLSEGLRCEGVPLRSSSSSGWHLAFHNESTKPSASVVSE
jgi:hypothetical protein